MCNKRKQRVKSHKRKKKGGKRKTRTVNEYDRIVKTTSGAAKAIVGVSAVTVVTTKAVDALKT